MRKIFGSVFVVLALGLLFGIPSIAAPNPPVVVDSTFDLPADFFAPGQCAFPVRLSLAGKGKTIALPSGAFIFTSPDLNATVTNLFNSHQVTLNVTGAFHQTTEANGDVVTVVTGRNLLGDPEAGFVLAIGNFSYAFDAGGNLIQPLAGRGTLTDICGLIE
jgi:hypothetical protein